MKIQPFHSSIEIKKDVGSRVFHDNNKCPLVDEIPSKERVPGRSNYRLCKHCAALRSAGIRRIDNLRLSKPGAVMTATSVSTKLDGSTSLWRYMSLDKLVDLLSTRELQFAPLAWFVKSDPFEGRLAKA